MTLADGADLKAWFANDDALGGRAWRGRATRSFALGHDFLFDLVVTRVHCASEASTSFWHGQVGVPRPFGPVVACPGCSDTPLRDNPHADGRPVSSLTVAFA